MNNIFKFAPSELVFDAFVCWTLNFFNEGNFEERKYSEEFINLIYKKKYPNNDSIKVKKIDVLKKQFGDSLIDVYVKIITLDDKKIHLVFEDKRDTSHHSNQLERHMKSIEKENGDKIFIYFKIGNIYNEKDIPKEYIILDRKIFLSFLKNSNLNSDVLKMYVDYLEELQEEENEILRLVQKTEFTEAEDIKLFGSQYGGYMIMDKISQEKYEISIGTSFGKPWTNFTVFSEWNPEINLWRGIYWRLDWRINDEKKWKPYLCLRNYKTSKETTEIDNKYFNIQREIFKELESKYNEIIFSKVHNKGAKEREIGILFFEKENTIKKIVELIPKFTEDFKKLVIDKKVFYNL